MRRRELLGGVAALLCCSRRAMAQRRATLWRVAGLFTVGSGDSEAIARTEAFERGMRELGWRKGENIQLDYFFTGGDSARLNSMAAELLATKPDVILANGPAVVRALGGTSQTIPIVFALMPDPVGDRLVASLARPGGMMTGFTNFEFSMGSKWMELLSEVAPTVKRVSVLFNPAMAPYAPLYMRSIEAGRPVFGIEPVPMPVRDLDDLHRSMKGLGDGRQTGLIVLADLFTTGHNEVIVSMAQERHVPAIYPFGYFARKGGLLSYGVDTSEPFYKAASYVDRILKGAKPADLPVQQPTRFQMIINLKAAKALGIEVPPMLLARADEVIE